jgi:hypothetical protein
MPLTPVDLATRQPHSRLAVPVLGGLALVALLAAGVILGPPAEGAPPCHVPGDYDTIQEALDERATPSMLRPGPTRNTSRSAVT